MDDIYLPEDFNFDGNENYNRVEEEADDDNIREGYIDFRNVSQEIMDDEGEDEDEEVNDDILLQDVADNDHAPTAKRQRKEKNSTNRAKWVFERPDPGQLKKQSSVNIVRERPGPTGEARHADNELDCFLLFMTNEMIERIVHCTNEQMCRVRNLSGRSRDSGDFSVDDTDSIELKCLFGLFLFRGIYQDVHMPCEDLWYKEMASRKIYDACMSYKRFVWLMRCLTFDERDNIRSRILDDRFARMRWLMTQFEKNARKSYNHSELVCIDETLRNFYGRYQCDFKVYLPDKPGKYGLLFRTIADCKDRYVSRVEPYVTPAANEQKKKEEPIHELVLKLCSDLFGTGRNVTGDRLYSSVQTTEQLFDKGLTYVGTVNTRRKGIPNCLRNKEVVKDSEREVLSSKFAWKLNSPLMMVSYVPKKKKNVIMMTSMHDMPNVSESPGKKPEVIEFYNTQRCGVDIVNEMLKDFSSQPTSNSWTIVVFTFILDLCGLNGCTIFKYNRPNEFKSRRIYLERLGLQLVVPHLIRRLTPTLQSRPRSAIESVLKDDAIQPPVDPNIFKRNPPIDDSVDQSKKCHKCIFDLTGLPNQERRRKKGNLNKQKHKCNTCHRFVCQEHIARRVCELCEQYENEQ